ncbi:hypothetical protein HT105_22700, partial [Bacteroides fragilis]|nr:hypothetical protein [Bacteroides fragilis]
EEKQEKLETASDELEDELVDDADQDDAGFDPDNADMDDDEFGDSDDELDADEDDEDDEEDSSSVWDEEESAYPRARRAGCTADRFC